MVLSNKKTVTSIVTILSFTFVLIITLFSKNAELWDRVVPSPQQLWIDSVFNNLTRRQKISQLFMVQAYSNKGNRHEQEVMNLITKQEVGGLIFFQGGPMRQAKLTNLFQDSSNIPLLIGMDLEWGLGMRLDSTISYPRQMMLGAIQNNRYIYQMGEDIARQCRRLGIHINFAPVADINSNPNNPVIGTRSFGENKVNVARKAIAYMRGMQDNGIIACAKHFPGHGDTDSDSHKTLPIIKHSKERIFGTELYPFQEMVNEGVMGMMVAHLNIPSLDSTNNRASTLSPAIVTGLARDRIQFKGLLFTDALEMKGVSTYDKPEQIALQALIAGNDVLLMPENVESSIKAIEQALTDGKIDIKMINEKVKKVLEAKFFAGLNRRKPIQLKNLYKDLNKASSYALIETLCEQAITVVKNDDQVLPVKDIAENTFAVVYLGKKSKEFSEVFSYYVKPKEWTVNSRSATNYASIIRQAKEYSIVVVCANQLTNSRYKKYNITKEDQDFIQKLQENEHTKVITIAFGNPYSLKELEIASNLICTYKNNTQMQRIAPQHLFGANSNSSSLPISASETIKEGASKMKDIDLGRLQFGLPESVGMDSDILAKIDSIGKQAINIEATPGCQILVARHGKVVYHKSFGHHTYEKKRPVTSSSVYDLASLTKVLSSLQAIMSLEEKRLIDLHQTVSYYLPETDSTNKGDMILKEVLTHQAGLKSFIPFWRHCLDEKGKLSKEFIQTTQSDSFPFPIARGLYSKYTIEDSVWQWTLDSDLLSHKNMSGRYNYWYSDLGYYIMQRVVEKIVEKPLHQYVTTNIYTPLGLQTMTYNPRDKIPIYKIVPTELDASFRKSLIQGYVHDPGAALVGGTTGHAGLFSNTLDIAILLQMNLQRGYYGGRNYIDYGTLGRFNYRPYEFNDNRRGIGWDKPMLHNKHSSTSELCSDDTFGHTGFTGTCAWVDPKYDLIYIFLSNRIHPYVNNRKLIRKNFRTDIQNLVYLSMNDNL